MTSSLQDIVCCMGQPLGRNPTQYMMEKAFAAANLDWRYLTLEVPPENLAAAVTGMKAMGFRGGNFASPHQVSVVAHADRLSESVELIGAVNCLYVEDGEYVGENTDGKGFLQAFQELSDPSGQKVVILGAGGTARAISFELALAGAREIVIANRSTDRGQALVDSLQSKVPSASLLEWSDDFVVDDQTDLLVQATAIGLRDAAARVPVVMDSLSDQLVVADVIHNPPRTRFLREAAEQGCTLLDGIAMLVHQAARDFSIWTGIEPDKTVMRESVEEYFEL